MHAYPEQTIRISMLEPIALDSPIQGVGRICLKPEIGDELTTTVEKLNETIKAFKAPNKVSLEWIDNDGNVKFTSYIEIVSRHYFPLEQLRNYNPNVDGFDDTDVFTDDDLFIARQAATDVFEAAAGRSFVHRLGRTKDYGRDNLIHLAHNDVYEIIDAGYVQVSDCQLERGYCPSRVYPCFINYFYGADEMPSEVSRAVLELAAFTLRPSNRPVGATGESSDAGYIHFTTAGRDGATAIPEVNAAIQQFGRGEQFVW